MPGAATAIFVERRDQHIKSAISGMSKRLRASKIVSEPKWSLTLWSEKPCLFDVTSADYSSRIKKDSAFQ